MTSVIAACFILRKRLNSGTDYWADLLRRPRPLPPHVRKARLVFDHYYSDQAFPAALPLVFADAPKRLLDVGVYRQMGHPMRETRSAGAHHHRDAPATGARAREHPRARLEGPGGFLCLGFSGISPAVAGRPRCHLDEPVSRLFPEQQIVSILRRAVQVMTRETNVHILELFWDRQPNETAAFCLQQTSLYLPASPMATPNVPILRSEACLAESGLRVVEDAIKSASIILG